MPKYAFVTGASRGIGKAIAQSLAKEGYDLFLTCKTQLNLLEHFAKELTIEYHISCKYYLCDGSDYEQVANLMKSLPPLDVLVNNAGIAHIGLLSDMSKEEWDSMIGNNLNAVFHYCKHVIPGMVSQKSGKIINISSVWGQCGASMEVAYSATKGAVNAFTKALAKELAPSNIQVNAIACGCIDTEMNHCFSEEERALLIEDIPADRFGTPEEVGQLVINLLSSPAYLTGQIITLDGGWI